MPEDRPLKAEFGVKTIESRENYMNYQQGVCLSDGWAYYGGACAARHVCIEKPNHEGPHRCQCGFTFERVKPE